MATHSGILAWRIPWTGSLGATVHRVAKRRTRLKLQHTCVLQYEFSPSLQAEQDFPGGSDGKASAYNAGDPGPVPGLGRSPGEGNGNPLQYPCLENPVVGGT